MYARCPRWGRFVVVVRRVMSTAIGSWSVCLALVLSHLSCSAAAATSLHLVACGSQSGQATAGALVDFDGGAANFIFSHSSSAADAAIVFSFRHRHSDGASICDLSNDCDSRVREASSVWQPQLRTRSAEY